MSIKWTQETKTSRELLKKVVRLDKRSVTFAYDPLGRRISKTFDNKVTRYIWNGNNIIHEWVEVNREQPPQNIQTWLFEDGTFTPFAKLTENKSYAVVTDHLGSPKELINQNGKVAWKFTLYMYEMVRSLAGGTTTDSKCNFRFPGQYEDEETGLFYNRFRYYMPSEEMYTQRDPIGLAGGNPTVYGYTWNSLTQVDPFGLSQSLRDIQQIINDVFTAHLPQIHTIDSSAIVGYRGSTASGISKAHDIALSRPFNPNDFDVDAFIISDILSNNRPVPKNQTNPISIL